MEVMLLSPLLQVLRHTYWYPPTYGYLPTLHQGVCTLEEISKSNELNVGHTSIRLVRIGMTLDASWVRVRIFTCTCVVTAGSGTKTHSDMIYY